MDLHSCSLSFKRKIIDIFDRETENFYKFYTAHLRNYNYVYRSL